MEQDGFWSHEAVYDAQPESAAKARAFVRDCLELHDKPSLIEAMRLVVSELATNALTHARTPFTVGIRGDEASVVLTVRDGSSSVPTPQNAKVFDSGGRGLAIVQHLSRDWGFAAPAGGLKSVWASFDVAAAAPTGHHAR